jgi:hypothetical protein
MKRPRHTIDGDGQDLTSEAASLAPAKHLGAINTSVAHGSGDAVTASSQAFPYETLDIDTLEIRVITLRAGTAAMPIFALSSMWPRRRILVAERNSVVPNTRLCRTLGDLQKFAKPLSLVAL